jgi:hypothetical protein
MQDSHDEQAACLPQVENGMRLMLETSQAGRQLFSTFSQLRIISELLEARFKTIPVPTGLHRAEVSDRVFSN